MTKRSAVLFATVVMATGAAIIGRSWGLAKSVLARCVRATAGSGAETPMTAVKAAQELAAC